MKLLEERILKDGRALNEDVLKVDGFLNHQMDIELFNEMGKEWYRLFQDGAGEQDPHHRSLRHRHGLRGRPVFPLSGWSSPKRARPGT